MCEKYQVLLIPDTEIDPALLDSAVCEFFAEPTNTELQNILNTFSENEESWKCFPQVFSCETHPQTKFIVLNSMHRFISSKWWILEDQEKSEIQEFLLKFITENATEAPESLLSKADQCLVRIMKYEWPQNFPNFLENFISESLSDMTKIANALVFMQLFVQEISTPDDSITVERSEQIISQFSQDFSHVSLLIQASLSDKSNEDLITKTMKLVKSLVPMINLDFVYQMDVFANLIALFPLSKRIFIEASSVYGDIARSPNYPAEFESAIPEIFTNIMAAFNEYNNEDALYKSEDETENLLIASTLTSFIIKYYKLLCSVELEANVTEALQVILKMTESFNEEAFQNCVEFWTSIATTAYGEKRCQMEVTTEVFLPFLPQVLRIIVTRIVAPYDLLQVEESSKSGSKFLVNVQPGVLYETMRDFIVYSTHLMPEETVQAISEKFEAEEVTVDLINSICWSTGAIGGVLEPRSEQELITPVISSIIELIGSSEGELKYAAIAGMIFIAGSLKKYFELDDNIEVLDNTTDLTFSVLPEIEEEQQIMIATYFKKTAKLSAELMNATIEGKDGTILQRIVQVLLELLGNISPQAFITMLDAVTTSLKATKDAESKVEMISNISLIMKQLLDECSVDEESIESTVFTIRCMKVLAYNIGDSYVQHFLELSPAVLALYSSCNQAIDSGSEEVFALRSEILDLYTVVASQITPRNECLEAFYELCFSSFISDYANCAPQQRDFHILLLFGHIALKAQKSMPERISMYFTNLFAPTAVLFEENVIDFMEFSLPLLFLMKSIIRTSLSSLISLGEDSFQLFLSTLDALINSPNSDVCDSALGVLQDMFTNIETVPSAYSQQFYNERAVKYALDVIRYLSTPQMKGSFGILSSLFKRLLKLHAVVENLSTLASGVIEQFPCQDQGEIEAFIASIMQAIKPMEFKQKLRDFLVCVRVYRHKDPDLYKEEAKKEQEQKMQDRLQVPGLVEGDLEKSELDQQISDLSGKFQSMNMSQK